MPTEKQLAANRLNAQKSTGPKTPEGKTRVAANALTHGLTAARPVLDSEDLADYDRFRAGMTARLAPAGHIETLLAERAINLAWRLQRVQNYETFILDNLIKSAADNPALDVPASADASAVCHSHEKPALAKACGGNPAPVTIILGQVLLDDFTGPQVLEKLLRYESRIERALYKALKELQTTQSLNPMISPGKDNSSLYPRHGIEELSQRGGTAKRSLTVEQYEPSIHSNRIVDHTNPQSSIKNQQSSNPANPVKNTKSSLSAVANTITLSGNLELQPSIENRQSPVFSAPVLNKLLQNKPNLPESRPSRLCT